MHCAASCGGIPRVLIQAHYRTLAALPIILGDDRKDDAEYLESCRRKRNIVEYDRVGGATDTEADELIRFGLEFRDEVVVWVKRHHSDLA